ncbi:MAG TPA: hypothetical protein VLC09_20020 [Polyangiaceae bacterium]|nr:hypothetical protein [Polyangiaceae bacterium]
MSGLTWRRLAALLRVLAAFGFFVLVLRVAWVTRELLEARAAARAGAQPRVRGGGTHAGSDGAPGDEPAADAGGPPPGAPEPVAVQRTLWVKLGPARSLVYVNGVRLGETPYAGDWSCVDGSPVEVTVVPPNGVPMVRRLICAGTLLVIKDAER